MAQFLPSQIFDNIPDYTGKGSCVEWLDKFNQRCAHFEFDDLWKLNNMEKFLLGPASDWWVFSKQRFLQGLSRHNAANRYTGFVDAIKSDFPEVDIKKQATKENTSLKFKVGVQSARDYVFKKRALFARIDPNMSLAQQLEYLYDGLPEELSWAVKRQLGAEGTVQKFIAELKCFADHWAKQNGVAPLDGTYSVKDACEDLYKFPKSGGNAARTSANVPPSAPASVPQSHSLLPSSSNVVPQSHSPAIPDVMPRFPPMVPVCQYCGRSGHLLMACEFHRQDYMPRHVGNNNNNCRNDYSAKAEHSNTFRPHDSKPYDRPSNRNNNSSNSRSDNNAGNSRA